MSTSTIIEPPRLAAAPATQRAAPLAARLLQIPLIRMFSSITFGMIMLALILAYASFGSALPQLRGAVEMTEMQVFRHWSFAALIGLFAFSLTLATFLRVRWSVINLGVLTVHTGLLLLCFSAWWYFASKVEGDTILLTPRVQIMQASGALLPGGEIAARAGEVWEQSMPAFGGRVRVEVLNVTTRGLHSAAEAQVRVQLGDAAPVEQALALNRPPVAISDRLQLGLSGSGVVETFYDNEVAALHYRSAGGPELHWTALEGLPYFRERYLDDGSGPVIDREGNEVPSKRTWPHMKLAGFDVPTGWFEHWRLPLDVPAETLPFDVRVTGYLPYIAGLRSAMAPGGATLNPAAQIELALGDQKITHWLAANDPNRALLATAIPIEFRWVASEAEREALYAPLAGMDELVVEVRDAGVKRAYAVRQGESIEVEGTPYKLTVTQLQPNWPLMTPGYEGATSPVALVDVTNGEKCYNRTVVQRYPHLSQDIDEAGVRRKDGPYDPNLVLQFRSAARGWFMITAGEDLAPMMGVFRPDGRVERVALPLGRPAHVDAGGMHLDFTLASLIPNARAVMEPAVETLERRRPTVGRPSTSAIRLEFTGRSAETPWRESRWVSFSQYPHIDARAVTFQPPGSAQSFEFIYSRKPHALDARLGAGELDVDFFPGRTGVERWRSRFLEQQKGDDQVRVGMVQTNETFASGRWTFFQSGAAQDHWSFTILGVGNRNGVMLQVWSCVLITAGCLYAFYIKPILKRQQQAAVLATVAPRPGDRNGHAGSH